MSKPKAAVKAAATQAAASEKAPRLIPEHLLVPVDAGQWPTNLADDTAQALFDLIEQGAFIYKAAPKLGLKSSTVRQWRHRHPAFAKRIEEAEKIGAEEKMEAMEDFVEGIKDRDSCAVAREKRENAMEILQAKLPQIYKRSPFNSNSAVQVNVQVNFEQELLAARTRAFADRGLTVTMADDERTTKR